MLLVTIMYTKDSQGGEDKNEKRTALYTRVANMVANINQIGLHVSTRGRTITQRLEYKLEYNNNNSEGAKPEALNRLGPASHITSLLRISARLLLLPLVQGGSVVERAGGFPGWAIPTRPFYEKFLARESAAIATHSLSQDFLDVVLFNRFVVGLVRQHGERSPMGSLLARKWVGRLCHIHIAP